jgi:hypothetical protein
VSELREVHQQMATLEARLARLEKQSGGGKIARAAHSHRGEKPRFAATLAKAQF